MAFRSGFIGIVGPTNSGKSTLLNSLLRKKISIVSPKIQTTLHSIRGVLNQPSSQMVLVDLPGYHSGRDTMSQLLNQIAEKKSEECDLILWVFDVSHPRFLSYVYALEEKWKSFHQDSGKKQICVLNKIDRVPKQKLLPWIAELAQYSIFSDLVPVSAKTGSGVERLRGLLDSFLLEGEKFYPDEMDTDRPLSFRFSEIIREKIYQITHQEVPYSVRIEMEESYGEKWEEAKVPVFRAIIYVDSYSRKKILIGKNGQVLKKIGIAAREELEKIKEQKICLKLHVSVQESWKKNSSLLHRYLEIEDR